MDEYLKPDSRISSVIVYKSGALVTRTADVEPLPGGGWPRLVKICDLPLALDDSSIRVKVRSLDEHEAPVAVDLKLVLEVGGTGGDAREPDEEELKQAERRLEEIAGAVNLTNMMIEQVSALEIYDRGEGKEGAPPPVSPLKARMELADFKRERLNALRADMRSLNEQRRRQENIVEDLRYKHEQASTDRQAREDELRKAVRLRLNSSGAAGAGARLYLEYFVPGARWLPSYALCFSRDYTKVDLQLKAHVVQKTGEDWNNVEITLSTADALSWTDLPELSSIRIGRRQPEAQRPGWRPPPQDLESLYSDYEQAFAGLGIPGPVESATESQVYLREDTAGTVDYDGCLDDCVVGAPAPPPSEAFREAKMMEMIEPDESSGGEALYCSDVDVPSPKRAAAVAQLAPQVMFNAVCEPPAPPAPAAPASPKLRATGRARSAMKSKKKSQRSQGAAGAGEGGLSARNDMLDYSKLRLPSPDEADRGKLKMPDRELLYREMLLSTSGPAGFDPAEVIKRARRDARSVAGLSPPPSCLAPDSFEGFDHAYQSASRVDVASDGLFHIVPLFSTTAQSSMCYVVVPRESKDAYRVASFGNPLSSPLLSGPADIKIGSDFLMSTRLSTIAPLGRVELGLGVEQGIKTARNTHYFEESSGLLVEELRLCHKIEIEVANNLDSTACVEVRERIPAPAVEDDDLRVEITTVEPSWEKFQHLSNSLRSAYKWRISVEPGGKQALHVEYEIKLSAKKRIVGGNRREA